MEIQKPTSLWAKSTEARLAQYLDEFLFRYKQSGVRVSTQSLLHSLFKKGNSEQRKRLLMEIISRIKTMGCTGQASQQIIGLVRDILKLRCIQTKQEQTILLNLVGEKVRMTLSQLTAHPDFGFYRFCENMIDYGKCFRPYLFELNGCIKCYGDIENSFTPTAKRIDQIIDQVRVSGNRLIYQLKMVYEIKDLVIRFAPKNSLMPPSFVIWYTDQNTGTLVKYGNYNSQPVSLTTNQIQLEMQNLRSKGGKCMLCGRSDDSSSVCANCRKTVEVELKFKRLGGEPEKIMRQLGENYKILAQARKRVDAMYRAVSNCTTLPNAAVDMNEIERVYHQIMLNLSLLETSESRPVLNDYKVLEGEWACFSCNYIQADNLISFLNNIELLQVIQEIHPKFIHQQLEFLLKLYEKERLPNSLNRKLLETLGTLCLLLTKSEPQCITDIFKKIHDFGKVTEMLKYLILKVREIESVENSPPINQQFIKQLFLNISSDNRMTPIERVELAAAFLAKKEHLDILYSSDIAKAERVKQVKKLSDEQALPVGTVLNFDKQLYLRMPVTNSLLLLMCLLPVDMLPESTMDIADETIIPYINNRLPAISKELTIVMSPKPMLPLDAFKVLPALAASLAPRDGLLLVMEILKFKSLWNINLYNTLQSCDTLMETLDRGEQLRMCLWGLLTVYEEYFLTKIHRILVPKRRQFIIKVDPPEKQLKKSAIANNQQWEYQMIRIRELKTEDLPGYTMKEVRDWITKQLSIPMGMDLIVEGYLIDDVSSPIEMVYKKLVNKDESKQPPLLGQPDTFRVIYRLRGFFGQPVEKDAGNLGDEQKDLCLSYAPILTELVGDTQTCGLDIIFRLFKRFEKTKDDRDTKKTLLDILNMVFKSQVVRIKAIDSNYADILIRATLRFLSSKEDYSVQYSQSLLETVEKLIDQANRTGTSNPPRKFSADRKGSAEMDIEQDKTIQTAGKNVNLVLTKITEDDEFEKSKQILELIKLLPFSSKDLNELSDKIYQYLKPAEAFEHKTKIKLERIYAFLDALPESFVTFKRLCYESGLLHNIIESTKNIFPNQAAINEKTIVDNEQQLLVNLTYLRSLSRGFEDLQKDMLQQKLIPILHRLSLIVSKQFNGKITAYAEQIIKNLAQKQLVYSQAAKEARELVERHKQQNKKKAMASKQSALQEMRKKRANAAIKNAIDIVPLRKQYLTCVSCKAGYEQRNSLMGIYSFWVKHEISSLESWWTEGKRSTSITSLTTFTPIHYECHKEGQGYNSQQKKTEWQGAQIRNSETKCNNWIPIRGPTTTDEEFDKISRKYFDHNKGGNFWVVVNDLKGLMCRLANQEELPKDSNGSIPNNMKLVAVLIEFSCGLMRKSEEQQYIRQGMIALQHKVPDTYEQMYLFMTNGIFTNNWTNSVAWRQACYNKVLAFAASQNKDNKDLFTIQKPLLVFLSMIQFIFETIHQKIDKPGVELLLSIEDCISKNLEPVLTSFEKYTEFYKENLVKKKSVAQFDPIFKLNQ